MTPATPSRSPGAADVSATPAAERLSDERLAGPINLREIVAEALLEASVMSDQELKVTTLLESLAGRGIVLVPAADSSAEQLRTTAEAQIQALEAALRPFAEAMACLDERDDDDRSLWETPAAMELKAGDLRRAWAVWHAAALTDGASPAVPSDAGGEPENDGGHDAG